MGEVEYSGKGSFSRFVFAGAIAGTAEHCGMFPLDTIKVRLQKPLERGRVVCCVRPVARTLALDTLSLPAFGVAPRHRSDLRARARPAWRLTNACVSVSLCVCVFVCPCACACAFVCVVRVRCADTRAGSAPVRTLPQRDRLG